MAAREMCPGVLVREALLGGGGSSALVKQNEVGVNYLTLALLFGQFGLSISASLYTLDGPTFLQKAI